MCGRCGQVWHVVMAKMGDRIAKVVCKRCGGHHRYRDENADTAAAAAAGGDAAARPRRPTFGSSRRSSRQGRGETAPTAPPFDPSKPPRTYAPRDSYVAGERVAHPTFGVGVVSGSPGAGKVEVVFGSSARVLACAKETSTLARPVAMQGLPLPDRPPTK
jgi:hypothetical protein